MPHTDSELKNWHDWTDPDFFATNRHRESRAIPLFLRQIMPASLLRTKMTLTGWCLVAVSLGLGAAAYNTTSNILFLALSLLLSSLILSGILSLINFKKLDWNLKVPTHFTAGQVGAAEINLVNKKSVFPSMSICFHLKSEMTADEERLYMQHALNPGESSRLEWVFTPQKRGQFELCIAGAQSQFPFGFLQKTIGSESKETVIVWPKRVEYVFKVSAGGQRVHQGAAKKKLGQGNDLLNIRPYERGDAPRLVHWKATARTGQLMIRQLAQEGESGYHLRVDTDASKWSEEQFEQLCSLVCSLSDDLFHYGRLETVAVGGSAPKPISTIQDLHIFFDEMSLLERKEKSTGLSASHRLNQITFSPINKDAIVIFTDGIHAGQIDN